MQQLQFNIFTAVKNYDIIYVYVHSYCVFSILWLKVVANFNNYTIHKLYNILYSSIICSIIYILRFMVQTASLQLIFGNIFKEIFFFFEFFSQFKYTVYIYILYNMSALRYSRLIHICRPTCQVLNKKN